MSEHTVESAGLGPVPRDERIAAVDGLRGIALFGIIAANMRAFNSPQAAYFDHSLMWTGAADRLAQGAIDLWITGKFITLFSFLFGIGFAIQMERASARGLLSSRLYFRRLAALFGFGLIHMFLFWWGDILATYALMGLFLPLFRKRSDRGLLIWAAVLYCWPLAVSGFTLLAVWAGAQLPQFPKTTPEEIQRLVQVFAHGAWMEIFQERLKELAFMPLGLVFYFPRILGIFLMGLWVWRKGIVRNLAAHAEALHRWSRWALPAGLAGCGGMLAVIEVWHPDPMAPTPLGFVRDLLGSAGIPALSLFYAAAVGLLYLRADWAARLRPFEAVGKTALTNYLLQTVICTALFYSWGLGLFGSVGPAWGLVPTFVIYAAQLAASVWWMNRFSFGPMEWVWRAITYGRWQPISAPRFMQAKI